MGETILPERSIRNMHYTRLELYDPLKKNRFLRTNGARTRGGGRKLEKLVKGERIERPVSIDLFRSRAFAAEPIFPPKYFSPSFQGVRSVFEGGKETGKKGEKVLRRGKFREGKHAVRSTSR